MTATGWYWGSFPENKPPIGLRLPIGGLVELYDRTGLEPDAIAQRLLGPDVQDAPGDDEDDFLRRSVSLFLDDGAPPLARQVLEVALVWAGHSREFARDYVERYAQAHNTAEAVKAAILVLQSALTAPSNDPFPKYPRRIGKKDQTPEPPSGSAASSYYQYAGAAGIDPQSLAQLSVWQYAQMAYGRYRANTPLDKNMITAEEEAALNAMLDEAEAEEAEALAQNPD